MSYLDLSITPPDSLSCQQQIVAQWGKGPRLSRRVVSGCIAVAYLGVGRSFAQPPPIRVGMSAGLTGPITETVKAYTEGIQVPIEKANRDKGVAGRRIELTIIDDKYQPAIAISNTEAFLNQQTNILLGYPGTPTVAKTLEYLDKRDVLMFGPFTGAVHLRKLNSPNAVFVTGDYNSEIDRLIDHFTTIGNRRFAILFQDDPFGRPLAEYAQSILARKGIQPLVSLAIVPGSPATPAQIERITREAPHTIFMFTVAGPTIGTISAMRKTYAGNIGLLSFLSNRAFINALGKGASGVVISQVTPGPYDLNHPLIREIFANRPDPSIVTHAYIIGYLISDLFVRTLKASGGQTSPAKFRTAWNIVRTQKPFGFSFDERGVAKYIDIAMLRSDGRFIR